VLSQPGALESAASGRDLVVEVIDVRGRILARSLTLGARLLPEDRLARAAVASGRTGYEDVSIDGRPFRVYDAPIASGVGGPAAGGAVIVGSDTSDISDTLGRLGLVAGVAGAVVALVAVTLAAVLSRRGLRPLRQLVLAAGEIERTADPSRRLPATDGPEEIAQLAGVLNRMLDALERSGQSERRFLADASHELRTPVTALLGNVEFVARHGADDEVVADLRRDAERLARLVDDLLVMERSSGSAVEHLSVVSLDEVVADVAADHDGGLVVSPLEPVSVVGDRDALTRMLQNLVSNAVVHGPPGGKVSVTLRHQGSTAVLSVSDEGPGPDRADGERVFERFWRAAGASGRPGSGLGLSIVGAIVDRHGGRISVDGSTFTVELPAAE
jgi:signal transduction histidine kinase